MARQLRIELAGGLYHVLVRGNNKKRIFTTLRDRDHFLTLLSGAHEKYSSLLYAYALLPNHYHLLVETRKKNLSKLMHFINVSYSVYFNRKYKRVGHLFQGRFKSIIVQKESYLLELSRYIHTNVDRAGIKGKTNDRRWTSYCYYANSCSQVPWLHTEWIVERFGKDWQTAQEKYRQFVESNLEDKIESPFRNTYKGVILGDDSFVEEMKRSSEKELGCDFSSHKSLSRWYTLDAIVELVSQHFKIPPSELFVRKRLFLPRQIAMYLVREHTDLSIRKIGEHFNVTACAVSQNSRNIVKNRKAVKLIEEINRLVENY